MAQERITVDPNRMRGLPSIRDTRVTVSAVLGQLAAGASVDELLADYPYLEREDVLAALEYAAAAAQERELAVVAPAAWLLLDANLSPAVARFLREALLS
jgi:uncharacterized protein (DUF433 family)